MTLKSQDNDSHTPGQSFLYIAVKVPCMGLVYNLACIDQPNYNAPIQIVVTKLMIVTPSKKSGSATGFG